VPNAYRLKKARSRGVTTHSILRIPVREEAEQQFTQAFKDLGVFRHASDIDGFRGGRLFRPTTDGEPFVVIASWDGPDAYESWLQAPVRDELVRTIEPLLAGEMSGGVYEVADEVGPA
jgi:heme-degrading monooxygenase HmoA